MSNYKRILGAFSDELEAEPPPFPGWDLGTRKNTMREGEGRVVLASRGRFDHVGLDMGDDSVIHWTGEIVAAENATVERTTRATFAKGEPVRYADLPHLLSPHLSCLLAWAHVGLGSGRYDPFRSNCESVALLCASGLWLSRQVMAIFDDVYQREGSQGKLGALLEVAADIVDARLEWQRARQEMSQPAELVIPPTPVPYAYGELYQGLRGHWHTRAQVLPTWPQEYAGTTRGAWLRGPPWRVDDVPDRGWPIVGSGLGSLEGTHRELVERTVAAGSHFPNGPWRRSPDTPLGTLSSLLGEHLEATLTRRAWLWVDHNLGIHVRCDDQWLRGPKLTLRALPGAGISPVLAAAMIQDSPSD